MQFTDIQRGMMRHALGLDRRKYAYRNYYNAGSEASNAAWLDLCRQHLAVSHSPMWFKVTKAGFAEVALPGETFDAETFIGAKVKP